MGVARALGAIGLVVGYAVLFALAHPLIGATATILAMAPAIVGGAAFGLRWGVTITLAAAVATVGLWYVFGDVPGSAVLRVGSGVGAVVAIVVAAALGRLRDLEQEGARRLREREGLIEARGRSEQWLQGVAGQVPVVLLAFGPDGRILLSTGAGLTKVGLADGSLDGRSAFDLSVDEPDRAALRSVLAGTPAVAAMTVGEQRLSLSYWPTVDADGRVTGGVGIAIVDRPASEGRL